MVDSTVRKSVVGKQKRLAKKSFTQKLLQLISEPGFVRLEHILGEPNIFQIVGRTHYERWHSCFWGWLFDPNGSHLTFSYPVSRLMLLLQEGDISILNKGYDEKLFARLTSAQFEDVRISPNEYDSTETSVNGVGRFDIFLSANTKDVFGSSRRLNILFEIKIDSPVNLEQAKRYSDWLYTKHPDDINLLVYFLPDANDQDVLMLGELNWLCVSYQTLHDKLLLPLLEHPSLNGFTAPFLVQYIKNLKFRHRGVKMAITEEERKIALALYEKYSDVFDTIYESLLAEKAIDYSIAEVTGGRGRDSGRIGVYIGGKLLIGDTVKTLFEKVLRHFVDNELMSKLPLPWGLGQKRYILTNALSAQHPNGRDFFIPVKYKGYTMESHYSRERSLKVLADLCNALEIDYSIAAIQD